MAARTTCNDLIDLLRGMTEAGTADWTLGTAVFWDGDHMQQVIDRHRADIYRSQLAMIPKHAGGGTVQYFEHFSGYRNFEQTSGGTSIFIVEDATGADQGTALWTADYLNGKVTFLADTAGTTYYLTARSYDLNAAAAEIWRTKASHYAATSFDFSTDNMRVSRSQIVKHCREMADYYASMGGMSETSLYRSDIDDGALK